MKESRNNKYITCFLVCSLIGTAGFFYFFLFTLSSLSQSLVFTSFNKKTIDIFFYNFFSTFKFQTILALSS